MASRPRSSPIAPSAATAASRTSGSRRPPPAASSTSVVSTSSLDALVLPAGPRRHLDDARHRRRRSGPSRSMAGWRAAISTARRRTAGVGIGERRPQAVVVEGAEALEGAEGGGPHVADRPPRSPASAVATSPVWPARATARRSITASGRSVSVTTIHARPNAGDRGHHARRSRWPGRSWRPPPTPAAAGRPRGTAGRRCASARPGPDAARLDGAAWSFRLRSGSLTPPGQHERDDRQAGQPGHPNGDIVDRHAGRDVNSRPPPPPAGTVRRRSRWHRLWAVPLAGRRPRSRSLTVAVTAVAAGQPRRPARTSRDPAARLTRGAPYARPRARRRRSTTASRSASWPASPRSTRTAQGDIYFVTISEPTAVRAVAGGSAGGESCNRDLPPNVSRCSALPQIDLLTTLRQVRRPDADRRSGRSRCR